MISDPMTAVRLKRGQKEKIEGALSDAMAQLEIEDTGADELRKKVSDPPRLASDNIDLMAL
jgi:L1 cell adhesion molecule like protein